MSKATSSTRSVMITRSLCPRISWACCASCTLMVLSSLKIEPLGREHSNVTSWSENTFRPNSQSTPKKLSFWDLCRANGEKYTSKERIAAQGGSNGGLLALVMVTQGKKKFRAVIAEVPVADMNRFHIGSYEGF